MQNVLVGFIFQKSILYGLLKTVIEIRYRGGEEMSFIDLVKKRYSVRSFKDMPVEKEKLLQVLEAARNAPSACNFQPWHFIVITDEA